MILQEKELYLFNRNQAKSTGQGPSKAVWNSRDGQEQIKIAEDFANILNDEEALCQEAEQAENPNAFVPSRMLNTSHQRKLKLMMFKKKARKQPKEERKQHKKRKHLQRRSKGK